MRLSIIFIILAVLALTAYRFVSTDQSDTTTTPEPSDQVLEQNDTKDHPRGASLDLSGKQLREVPAYVFSQTHLEYLNLANNQLTGAIQAEIRFLSDLKELDLSNNQLTGVPAEVGQLHMLEELNLANNQLTGLPHELSNLKDLKTIDLRGNDPSEFDLNIIRAALPNTVILLD